MKSVSIVLMLLCFILTGCSGDNSPVNEGKDKPKKNEPQRPKDAEKKNTD